MVNIKKANEDFDDFLFKMDDQIDALSDQAERHEIQLDLTMDSLEELESLFFKLADNAYEHARESLIVTFSR